MASSERGERPHAHMLFVEPDELVFRNVRVNQVYTSSVRITNTLDSPVDFSIRPGSSQRYSVSPSTLSLKSGESALVEIRLCLPTKWKRDSQPQRDIFHLKSHYFSQKFFAVFTLWQANQLAPVSEASGVEANARPGVRRVTTAAASATQKNPPLSQAQITPREKMYAEQVGQLQRQMERMADAHAKKEEVHLLTKDRLSRATAELEGLRAWLDTIPGQTDLVKEATTLPKCKEVLRRSELKWMREVEKNNELEEALASAQTDAQHSKQMVEGLKEYNPDFEKLLEKQVQRERQIQEEKNGKILRILETKDRIISELQGAATAAKAAEDRSRHYSTLLDTASERIEELLNARINASSDSEKEIETLNMKVITLQDQLALAESRAHQVSEERKSDLSLRKELRELEQQQRHLEGVVQSQKTTIENFQSERESFRQQKEQYEKREKQMRATIDSNQKTLSQQAQAKSVKPKDVEILEQKVKDQEHQIDVLISQLAETSSQPVITMNKLSEQERSAYDAQIISLTKTVKLLEKTVSQLQQPIAPKPQSATLDSQPKKSSSNVATQRSPSPRKEEEDRRVRELQHQVSELRKEQSQIEEIRHQLQQQLWETTNKSVSESRKDEQIRALKHDIETLESALTAASQYQSENHDIAVTNIVNKNSELEQQVKDCQKVLAERDIIIRQLRDRVERLDNLQSTAQATVLKSEEKLSEAYQQMANLSTSQQSYNDSERLIEQLNNRVTSLRVSEEKAWARVREIESQKEPKSPRSVRFSVDGGSEVAEKDAEIQRLQGLLRAAKKEFDKLTAQQQQQSESSLNISSHVPKVQSPQHEIGELQFELKKSEEMVRQLNTTIADYQKQLMEFSRAERTLQDALTQERVQHESQLSRERLQSESRTTELLVQKEDVQSECRRRVLEITSLETKVDSLERELEQIRTNLVEKEEELKGKLESKSKEFEELRREHETAQSILDERQVQLQIMMETVETLQGGSAKDQRLVNLTALLTAQKAVTSQAERQSARLEKDCVDVRQHLEDARVKMKTLDGQLRDEKNQTQAVKKLCSSHWDEIQALKSELDQREEEWKKVSRELETQKQLSSSSLKEIELRDQQAKEAREQFFQQLQSEREDHVKELRRVKEENIDLIGEKVPQDNKENITDGGRMDDYSRSMTLLLQDVIVHINKMGLIPTGDPRKASLQSKIAENLERIVLESELHCHKASLENRQLRWELGWYARRLTLTTEELIVKRHERDLSEKRFAQAKHLIAEARECGSDARSRRILSLQNRVKTLSSALYESNEYCTKIESKAKVLSDQQKVMEVEITSLRANLASMQQEAEERERKAIRTAEESMRDFLRSRDDQIKEWYMSEASRLIVDPIQTDDAGGGHFDRRSLDAEKIMSLTMELCSQKLVEKELLDRIGKHQSRYDKMRHSQQNLEDTARSLQATVDEYARLLKRRVTDAGDGGKSANGFVSVSLAKNEIDELKSLLESERFDNKTLRRQLELKDIESESNVRCCDGCGHGGGSSSLDMAKIDQDYETKLDALRKEILSLQQKHQDELKEQRNSHKILMEEERNRWIVASSADAAENREAILETEKLRAKAEVKEELDRAEDTVRGVSSDLLHMTKAYETIRMEMEEIKAQADLKSDSLKKIERSMNQMFTPAGHSSRTSTHNSVDVLVRGFIKAKISEADAERKLRVCSRAEVELRETLITRDRRIEELKRGLGNTLEVDDLHNLSEDARELNRARQRNIKMELEIERLRKEVAIERSAIGKEDVDLNRIYDQVVEQKHEIADLRSQLSNCESEKLQMIEREESLKVNRTMEQDESNRNLSVVTQTMSRQLKRKDRLINDLREQLGLPRLPLPADSATGGSSSQTMLQSSQSVIHALQQRIAALVSKRHSFSANTVAPNPSTAAGRGAKVTAKAIAMSKPKTTARKCAHQMDTVSTLTQEVISLSERLIDAHEALETLQQQQELQQRQDLGSNGTLELELELKSLKDTHKITTGELSACREELSKVKATTNSGGVGTEAQLIEYQTKILALEQQIKSLTSQSTSIPPESSGAHMGTSTNDSELLGKVRALEEQLRAKEGTIEVLQSKISFAEEKVVAREEDLAREKNDHSSTKQSLTECRETSSSLESSLKGLKESNEVLEGRIKELTSSASSTMDSQDRVTELELLLHEKSIESIDLRDKCSRLEAALADSKSSLAKLNEATQRGEADEKMSKSCDVADVGVQSAQVETDDPETLVNVKIQTELLLSDIEEQEAALNSVAKLKRDKAQCNEECEDLQSQLDSLKQKYREEQKLLRSTSNELEDLKTEIETLQKKSTDREKALKEEIFSLKEKKTEESVKDTTTQSSHDEERTAQKLQDCEADLERIRRQYDDMRKEYKKYRTEQASVMELQAEQIDSLKRSLQKTRQSAEVSGYHVKSGGKGKGSVHVVSSRKADDSRQRDKTSHSEGKEQFKEVREEMVKSVRIKQLEESLQVSTTECEELRLKMKNFQAVEEELEQLKKTHAQCSERVVVERGRYTSLKTDYGTVRKERDKLKRELTQSHKKHQEDVVTLKGELTSAEEKISTMVSRKSGEQIRTLREDCKSKQALIKSQRDEMTGLSQKLEESKQKIEKLEAEVKKAKGLLLRKDTILRDVKSKVQQSVDQSVQQDTSKGGTKSSEKLEKQVQKLKEEGFRKDIQVREFRRRCDELNVEVTNLRSTAEASNKRDDTLKRTKQDVQRKVALIKALTEKVKSMEAEVSTLKEKNAKLLQRSFSPRRMSPSRGRGGAASSKVQAKTDSWRRSMSAERSPPPPADVSSSTPVQPTRSTRTSLSPTPARGRRSPSTGRDKSSSDIISHLTQDLNEHRSALEGCKLSLNRLLESIVAVTTGQEETKAGEKKRTDPEHSEQERRRERQRRFLTLMSGENLDSADNSLLDELESLPSDTTELLGDLTDVEVGNMFPLDTSTSSTIRSVLEELAHSPRAQGRLPDSPARPYAMLELDSIFELPLDEGRLFQFLHRHVKNKIVAVTEAVRREEKEILKSAVATAVAEAVKEVRENSDSAPPAAVSASVTIDTQNEATQTTEALLAQAQLDQTHISGLPESLASPVAQEQMQSASESAGAPSGDTPSAAPKPPSGESPTVTVTSRRVRSASPGGRNWSGREALEETLRKYEDYVTELREHLSINTASNYDHDVATEDAHGHRTHELPPTYVAPLRRSPPRSSRRSWE